MSIDQFKELIAGVTTDVQYWFTIGAIKETPFNYIIGFLNALCISNDKDRELFLDIFPCVERRMFILVPMNNSGHVAIEFKATHGRVYFLGISILLKSIKELISEGVIKPLSTMDVVLKKISWAELLQNRAELQQIDESLQR